MVGMDPYSSPYIIPNDSPQYPYPHSLLSTREFWGHQVLEADVTLKRFREFQDLGLGL